MKINTVSVFPNIIKNNLKYGIIGKSLKKNIIDIQNYSYTQFLNNNERIDDQIYGHDPGMVISYQKTYNLFKKIKENNKSSKFIFMSPKGILLNNNLVNKISKEKNLTIVCGRYEGFDQRIIDDFCDIEVSIGDYILSGGEIAASILIESVSRMIKGVVGKENSVIKDSFMNSLLKNPVYTKPEKFKGKKVPKILISGNHKKINNFNRKESLKTTLEKREDLLSYSELDSSERNELKSIKNIKFNKNIFISLIHFPVKNIKNEIIKTSLTNLDIQDIARTAKTYGINKYFITHPIKEQRMLAEKVINFWDSENKRINENSKHEAIKNIIIKNSINDVIKEIKKICGKKPTIISTDAKRMKNMVDYDLIRNKFLSNNEPILIVFGTGWGLTDDIINKSDYILKPIDGYNEYNHLSVRSAVAIILDKLFGCKF